jgi:CheY-like chemotaxis protein
MLSTSVPTTPPWGLVVDDDPEIRSCFAEALRRGGMHVTEAETGSVALRLAQVAGRLAFVVTDFEMPGLDGLELSRRLRRSAQTEKAVIVLVSGTSQGDAATAAGCDAVLPKPCSPAVLVATIWRLLNTKPS